MSQSVDAGLFSTPLMRTYLFYSAVLVVKMMVMSILTASNRFRYKAFANPEDGASLKVKPRTDDHVERVRRAHLNDLENITIFFVISFIYVLTNPSLAWATLLFRIYTGARIIHTLVYAVFVIPQPARALSWGTGYAITGYMAFQSILHFMFTYNSENVPNVTSGVSLKTLVQPIANFRLDIPTFLKRFLYLNETNETPKNLFKNDSLSGKRDTMKIPLNPQGRKFNGTRSNVSSHTPCSSCNMHPNKGNNLEDRQLILWISGFVISIVKFIN